MASMEYTRRRTLSVAGSTGLLALAGCLGGSGGDAPYGGHIDGANNFEGVIDRTDSDEVTVAVGAKSGLSFDPAAVRISTDTTVVWEWTGLGGLHNVVAEDGSFKSEKYFNEGETFSYTFDEPGVYKYNCTPHELQGMRGVVEVVEP